MYRNIIPFMKVNAIVYDTDAQAFFDACSAAGADVTDPYKAYYNDVVIALKDSGEWSNLDALYINATGNRTWAKISLKDPSNLQSSTVGGYSGDHDTDVGWDGDGTGFGVLRDYNPGTYGGGWVQNSATFGSFWLSFNNASYDHHSHASFIAGYGSGGNVFVRHCGGVNFASRRDIINFTPSFPQTYAFSRLIASGYCWLQSSRTASGVTTVYQNGYRVAELSDSSQAVANQKIGVLGAYNGSFTAGFYADHFNACDYYGNGNVDAKVIMETLNTYFFSQLSTRAKVNRITLRVGDSMSGSYLGADLSDYGYPETYMETKQGDGYLQQTVALSNSQVDEILARYSTEVEPYISTVIDTDVVFWAGRNDLARSTRTGLNVYNDTISYIQGVDADGARRIVIVGIPDTQDGFIGGASQSSYDTERADYFSRMLTTYNQSTSISNVYTSLSYPGYFVDTSADSIFEDASNTTYFKTDKIHPTPTLHAHLIDTYIKPILDL